MAIMFQRIVTRTTKMETFMKIEITIHLLHFLITTLNAINAIILATKLVTIKV